MRGLRTTSDFSSKFCHVNAQSVFAHLDEFREFFINSQFQLIAVSETWFKPSMSDDLVSLDGYDLLRHDRLGRSGGGVAIYFRKHLSARVLSISENLDDVPEFPIVEVDITNASKILIAVVYRPPKIGHLDQFEDSFSNLVINYKYAITFGDFNANLLSDNFDSVHLRNTMLRLGFSIILYGPTHHTATSQTWLDICAVNDADKVVLSGQLPVPFLSCHDLIFIDFEAESLSPSARTFDFRDFANIDSVALCESLISANWGNFGAAGPGHCCQCIE